MIPHSRPFIGKEEALAVDAVLKSGQLSSGPQVEALEEELSEFLGVVGSVACASGTAALHLALLALGANADTVVHIPSYVCSALWNAVRYSGARASIIDVSGHSANLSVEEAISCRKSDDDIVIFPHMFGSAGPVNKLLEAGFKVVEDCAQSIGSTLGGKLSGTFAQVSIFSFYATKVISAGEGGAVASDDREILEYIRDICDYDHKRELRLRFNYKMTDLQAALARVQLKRLPEFIRRRRQIAAEYDDVVEATCFKKISREAGDIYYRYIIECDDIIGTIARFRAEGVSVARPVFMPLHRYLNLGGYPNTEKLYRSWISLPCYPAMSDAEVEKVCQTILKVGSCCSAAQ